MAILYSLCAPPLAAAARAQPARGVPFRGNLGEEN
jgi:hypothetical protein